MVSLPVKIGSITLESANFAVGEKSNATTCVFGVGLIDGESTVTFSSGSNRYAEDTYINIPQQMYLNGDIGASAYSLWLNDIDSENGSILFGGVDHARYTGTLETVPNVNAYESGGISTHFSLPSFLLVFKSKTRLETLVPCTQMWRSQHFWTLVQR
jgi:yapsin 1